MEPQVPACVNTSSELSTVDSNLLVAKIVALGIIDLTVVLGNSLVVAAVLTTRKLRTVTNIFIVSLACADLLLGFAVLPFSISLEVDEWLWGQVWCSMWLAIDVWLCTASILSLCAISFDRFVAVTHPIKYPTLMSPTRGRWLVASVWILSFVICLPPLLGWNDSSIQGQTARPSLNGLQRTPPLQNRSTHKQTNVNDGHVGFDTELIMNLTGSDLLEEIYSNFSVFINASNCYEEKLTCELTTTPGYRIYAALGSFFIPMFIMVFFYFRIYLTAVKTAASIRKGILTTKPSGESSHSNGYGEEEMHLRVHRGGSASLTRGSVKNYDLDDRYRSLNGHGSRSSRVCLNRSLSGSNSQSSEQSRNKYKQKEDKCELKGRIHGFSGLSRLCPPISKPFGRAKQDEDRINDNMTELNDLEGHTHYRHFHKSGLCPSNISTRMSTKSSPSTQRCTLLIKEPKAICVKGHARKFKREAKAAKTLAIIVGAFIICWCPFFTIYLLGAFCYGCVSDLIFAVFFWLGYCNSALNPCIYALFARDFRCAFKRLVLCRRRKGFSQAARADFVTGTMRKRLTPPHNDKDSLESDN